MRLLAAPLFCLFGIALSAVPQQQAPSLNQLCAIQFDRDGAISTDSIACLDLLGSTMKIETRLHLLLTGTEAHTDAVKEYLTGNEAVLASVIRVQNTPDDANAVQSSLIKPLRRLPAPVAEGDEAVAGMSAPPPRPPAVAMGSPSKALNPYSLGDAAAAWKASLQTGAIEYSVPPVMVAQRGSTVTVLVHGYKDLNPHRLAPGSGTVSSAQKVSDMMEVDLIGSPTEFTIVPQATPATQFVPIDGYAAWIWSVTPVNQASAQQLTIKVSLIPDAASGLPTQPLAETPYTVNVTVESLWSVLADRWHQDPMKAIAYLLPGGAGWAALGTLLTTLGVGTWLRNKLNKTGTTPAPTVNQGATPAV